MGEDTRTRFEIFQDIGFWIFDKKVSGRIVNLSNLSMSDDVAISHADAQSEKHLDAVDVFKTVYNLNTIFSLIGGEVFHITISYEPATNTLKVAFGHQPENVKIFDIEMTEENVKRILAVLEFEIFVDKRGAI
jgi:hypothetical protein